jgi:LytS/YehU family sensor histidine kinase
MHGNLGFAPAAGDAGFVTRVASALDAQRVVAAAVMTLLLSLGVLINPALLDFFSPEEIALSWLGHLLELAVIAAALLASFIVLDEALPRGMPLRLTAMSGLLLALSAMLAVLLHAYYAAGFEHLPPPLRMLADSLRWGLPAVFLALIADVHRRALQADSAAHFAELARAHLEHAESEQRLAMLQAQIEPHFLFNILGNVRRLYRTRPQAGVEALGSLMRYLRTALPQLRSRRASLGEEVALVRAYLDLFQLRMGPQLDFSIDVEPALRDAEFPPMLLVTLVENAIKHGLEPAGGGRIEVRARSRHGALEVSVLDDGAGFGAAAISGSGMGLVNVRRQLAARYHGRGRLTLEEREPRGACATIAVPLPGAQAAAPVAAITAQTLLDVQPRQHAGGLAHWLRTHRGAVAIAGLLAFAAPLTFFTGALSVMRPPSAPDAARLGLWWTLYGALFWCLLVVSGYACERLTRRFGRWIRAGIWLLAACSAAAIANLLTAGRTVLLVEQGLVHSAQTAYLYAFTFSLVMALLFFAHLRRNRGHEEAAARLAAAQGAQRHARRRMAEAHAQEVQARIDPQILFEMLDAVRRLYERDAARAERLLDELILFLRAALPRLRAASSSLIREAELARAFVRLHALAGNPGRDLTIAVAPEVLHARFPPGVLLPLLEGAVRRDAGSCELTVTRAAGSCRLVLTLDAAPSPERVARVRRLLEELHGTWGMLEIRREPRAVDVIVQVPYEPA